MASITSLGVGSGLPLQDTLDRLASFEKERLNPVKEQQNLNTQQKNAYETLKSEVQKFQSINSTLKQGDLFSHTKATSTNSDIAVTASAGTSPGEYQVHVNKLATAHSVATKTPITSSKDLLGNSAINQRTLTITQSGHDTLKISLSAEQTSIEEIRDAINNSNSGISASIVKASDSDYRLVISAMQTGAKNKMTISVDGDEKLGSFLDNSNLESLVNAEDAGLTINGILISRSGNIITDAPEGVTLTLTNTGDSTIKISKNTEDAKTAIKKWMDSYNSLLDTIASLTKYVPVDAGAKNQSRNNGPLLGDSMVMTMKSQIRSQFILNNDSSKFKILSQIGIATTDFTTGKLTLIDEKKLDEALAEKPASVRDLFIGDSKNPGIALNVDKLLEGYLSSRGMFSTVEQSLKLKEVTLKKRFDEVNANVNDNIVRYKKQFTQLDMLVKKMDSMSKYLTQQFDALKKSTN